MHDYMILCIKCPKRPINHKKNYLDRPIVGSLKICDSWAKEIPYLRAKKVTVVDFDDREISFRVRKIKFMVKVTISVNIPCNPLLDI